MDFLYKVRLVSVEGVVGGKADLPCDVTTAPVNDTVFLIAWYKDDFKPIYSVDHRTKKGPSISDTGGSHWSEPDLEQRATFRQDLTRHGTAVLTLDKLRESDEGQYRCRVDFRTSPTHNNKVRLVIIVPPEKPRIVDERGKTLSAVAGPYEEGSGMTLTCVVSGGRPKPDISWWSDGAEVKSREGNSVTVGSSKGEGRSGSNMDITTRLLVVQNLSRSQLHTSYTCMASNSNKTSPLMTSVTIEMLLAPLSVNIVNSYQPLSKGKEFKFECQSFGSRPPAKISWWKDNLRLNISSEEVSDDGNITTSKLVFIPDISDHDGRLTCRAHNPRLATGVLEQAWTLNVNYVPKVSLEFGSKMNPNNIKEGDDVYFECIVDANPPAYKVIWRHNKEVVANNPKGGVMVTDSALAIQAVGRKNAGNYSCTAYNVEGDGRSNNVQLTVDYKPVCKTSYIRTVAVGRHEDIKLRCDVDAHPPAKDFQWYLNNTSGTSLELTLASSHSSLRMSGSALHYRPTSDADYGSLACKAANSVGVQEQPCLFIIIPAGGPEPLENCSVIEDTTSASLSEVCISCQQAPKAVDIDIAVNNSFHLEIHDRETNEVISNLTRNIPSFCISGRILTSSSELVGILYTSNSRGVSERYELPNLGHSQAHSQAVGGVWGGEKQGGSAFATVTSAAAVLVAVVIAIFIAVRHCWPTSAAQNSVQSVPVLQQHIPKLKSVADNVQQQQAELTADNNPDIIPYERESDYEHIPNESHNGRNKTTVRRCTPEEEAPSSTLYDSRQHTLLGLDTDVNSRSGPTTEWSEWGDLHSANVEPSGMLPRGISRQVISIRTLLGSSDQLESRV